MPTVRGWCRAGALAAMVLFAVAAMPARARFSGKPVVIGLARKTTLSAAPLARPHGVKRGARAAVVPRAAVRTAVAGSFGRTWLGRGAGSYYANITVAGLQFPVDVDTGSSLMAVPASKCVACATNAQCAAGQGTECPGAVKYDPASSPTFTAVPCPAQSDSGYSCSGAYSTSCGGVTAETCACKEGTYSQREEAMLLQCYADGSGWQGALMEDVLSVGGAQAHVLFVAKTLNIQDGESTAPFTGIIGLAYSTLSGVDTPFSRLVDQAGVSNVFTMCLGPSGGSLALGQGPRDDSSVLYTSIVTESYYVVTMNDFLVNGTSVGVASSVYNDGECIVDSGTTDLVLPHSAYVAFYNALQAMCSQGTRQLTGICGYSQSGGLFGGYEFPMTQAEVNAFPTITVVLSGVELMIPPDLYLTTSAGYTSLAAQDSGSDTAGTILGDTVMRGFEVVFDRERKRVGFGPRSSCYA